MSNNNKRRKDKDHDVGDSMPGTTGHSKGTHHDRMGGTQTYDPDEESMSEKEVEEWLGIDEDNGKEKRETETDEKTRQKE